MGTRGYKVYRYKGYYFIYYNHYDSYPDGLGVEFKSTVPQGDEEEYQEWLDALRSRLEAQLANRTLKDDEGFDFRISRKAPLNDILIEWVYEIDCDHEVFLVDNMPLFSLRNMPPTHHLFCQYIGFDYYGSRGYSSSTPIEYRYNWTALPPPVDDETIARYRAQTVSVDEILGVPANQAPPVWEVARIALYEILVSGKMQSHSSGRHLRNLETLANRADIHPALCSWGVQVMRLGLGRMKLGHDEVVTAERCSGDELVWIVPNTVCMRFATHLDDERNLKKQILELADEMTEQESDGFGILFSFFHCAIMTVATKNAGTVKATAALQFLPSRYSMVPATPGTEAIARLGLHINWGGAYAMPLMAASQDCDPA
ncbi:hypothetical protein C8F01DRAFT_1053667 [Mycena amicta]|nr:hypothetical protein C8F01DRAFT_1053667 [Mycena amicta]